MYHSALGGGDALCCELLLHDHAQLGTTDENGWQEIHQVGSAGAGGCPALPRRVRVGCFWLSLQERGSPALSARAGLPGPVGEPSSASLLPQACRFGHVQHLEHLLFYGADMGAQNASGNTALHICALYNQVCLQVYTCVHS